MSYVIKDKIPFTIDGKIVPCISRINNDIKVIRNNNKVDIVKPNLEFQVLDWRQYNDEDGNGKKNFVIKLFGKTRDKKTIYVQINKYKPFFYIGINKSWRQSNT